MSDREIALRALLNRIERVVADGDPANLLSPGAAKEANELAGAVSDLANDIEVASLLALFHLGRYEALPEGEDQDEFAKAAFYFSVVSRIKPGIVPASIREHLERVRTVAEYPADPGKRALTLLGSYRHTSDPAQLREAIAMLRDLSASDPADSEDMARYLSNLGAALRLHFEHTGEMSTLAEAVQVQRTAVAMAADDDRWRYQSNLCAALGTLSEFTGGAQGLELLTEAISAARAAVAALPASGADRGVALSGLGSALTQLAERTGDDDYLHEAARVQRAAAQAVPEGHPRRPTVLASLANTLQRLFDRTQDTALVIAAVDLLREAAAASVNTEPGWAGIQNSLGNALVLLSQRTHRSASLAEAIEAHRAATVAASADDPYRPSYLSNLGSAYLELAERTGNAAEFAVAIRAFREAVAATAPDNPDWSGLRSNLASALKAFGETKDDVRALTEAVDMHRAAVAATEPDHPEYAGRMVGLGGALRALTEHDDDPNLPLEARECFTQVADRIDAATHLRIWAYRQIAQLASAPARASARCAHRGCSAGSQQRADQTARVTP